MLKTSGKTTWGEIKIGEVFAFKACWVIAEKTGEKSSRLLAEDSEDEFSHGIGIGKEYMNNITSKYDVGVAGKTTPPEACGQYKSLSDEINDHLYKLPISVQQLWKT